MSWSTTDTKTAAVYAGLGFPVSTRETIIVEKKRHQSIRFHIEEETLGRSPVLFSRHLHQAWIDGLLQKNDPTHPLLAGYAACQNMDAIQAMAHGGAAHELRLEGGLWKYVRGDWSHPILIAPVEHRTKDLPLAAAVTLAGVPFLRAERVDGSPGKPKRHLCCFPDQSLALDELPVAQLFARRGTQPHPYALQLGLTHPAHVVVSGYNATRAYARFLAEINTRRILAKDPFSSRRVLMPEKPSARLEDEVRRFFRVP